MLLAVPVIDESDVTGVAECCDEPPHSKAGVARAVTGFSHSRTTTRAENCMMLFFNAALLYGDARMLSCSVLMVLRVM